MSIQDYIRKSQVKILDAIEYKHTLLWNYRTPGIPDELFERTEQVPITKEDVRALVLSKLRLKENSSAIDIGCGSGSITVELCLQTKDNKYMPSIDFEEKATELTRKNLLKFGLKAEVILSKADQLPLRENWFLLRINNQTGTEALRTFLPTAARDVVVMAACLTVERTSLPAFSWLWRNRYRLWAKRKEIQSKRPRSSDG